jgi:hypothetical protein
MFHQPSVAHPDLSWYPIATPTRLDVALHSFKSACARLANRVQLSAVPAMRAAACRKNRDGKRDLHFAAMHDLAG